MYWKCHSLSMQLSKYINNALEVEKSINVQITWSFIVVLHVINKSYFYPIHCLKALLHEGCSKTYHITIAITFMLYFGFLSEWRYCCLAKTDRMGRNWFTVQLRISHLNLPDFQPANAYNGAALHRIVMRINEVTPKGSETCSGKIISIKLHIHKVLIDASWPFILGSINTFIPHTFPLVGTNSVFFISKFLGFALKHTNRLIFRTTTIKRLMLQCTSAITLINPGQARSVNVVTPFKLRHERSLQCTALDSAICILEDVQCPVHFLYKPDNWVTIALEIKQRAAVPGLALYDTAPSN